jgi:hypothetical protein
VPIPYFCCFCVSEKLHRKYSQNWTKQKPKFVFPPEASRSSKLRRRRTRGQVHHRVARPSPWPRHQVVWPPGLPSDAALPPIYSPRWGNLKGPINFPRNILQAVVVDARSGGFKSSSRHPAGEGNHRHRPSSSPCLPPE